MIGTEFKVDVVIYDKDNKYNETEIGLMFLEFIESKGLDTGGKIEILKQ